MKKEASLQEKGLELFIFQDDEGLLEFESIEKMARNSLPAIERFLFQEELSSIINKNKVEKIIFHVELCSKEKIQQLNEDYRSKNKVTDVLSFPTQDDLRNGDTEIFIPELELGDIFICSQVCKDQAQEFNLTDAEEFIHLLIHGFLHLCGYDHELSEQEEQLMESYEKKILDKTSEKKNGAH